MLMIPMSMTLPISSTHSTKSGKLEVFQKMVDRIRKKIDLRKHKKRVASPLHRKCPGGAEPLFIKTELSGDHIYELERARSDKTSIMYGESTPKSFECVSIYDSPNISPQKRPHSKEPCMRSIKVPSIADLASKNESSCVCIQFESLKVM